MTITVHLETITTAISNLSVTGVKVQDITAIPADASLLGPILFPRPNDFVTEFAFERMSQGGGGTAMMNLAYTLNYVFIQAPLAQLSLYGPLVANVVDILEKLFASDNVTGAVDMTVSNISVGMVTGPNGKEYFGAEIALRVLEFVQ